MKFRVDSILSVAGEQDRIVTAGGVTAWQELALYLIARLCGPQHAIRTAKIHILSDHSDGQLPFAVITPRVGNTDAVIADCQHWIAENYACQNPVASMIAHSGLKPRTFARRFLAATGFHPVDYVHAVRMEEAKQRLNFQALFRLLHANRVHIIHRMKAGRRQEPPGEGAGLEARMSDHAGNRILASVILSYPVLAVAMTASVFPTRGVITAKGN